MENYTEILEKHENKPPPTSMPTSLTDLWAIAAIAIRTPARWNPNEP